MSKFLTPVDLLFNELKNVTIHNLSSNPSGAAKGALFYDTSIDRLKVNIGTSLSPSWTSLTTAAETGYAFATVTGGDGGSAVADATADTLTLSSANSLLTIVGSDVSDTLTFTVVQSNIDHGSIGGLSDDDHAQYSLLAGRAGGQSFRGGTGSSDNLTLLATSNGTNNGSVVINTAMSISTSAITFSDAVNFVFNTTTGTKFGTATNQKIGFFNANPVIKPSSTTDLKQALVDLGLYTSGGATPLDLNFGAITAGDINGSSLSIFQDGSGIYYDGGSYITESSGELTITSGSGDLLLGSTLNANGYNVGNVGDFTCGAIFIDTGSNGINFYQSSYVTEDVDGYLTLFSNGGYVNFVSSIDMLGTDIIGVTQIETVNLYVSSTTVFPDGSNIQFGTSTGSQIGTATSQKIGFFGVTPVAQQVATVSLETVLSNLGFRASGTSAPLAIAQLTIADGSNIVFNTTTGTKIGTSTSQKLSFYGVTPVAQQSATTDLKDALTSYGLITGTSASPLNLDGGTLTAAAVTSSSALAISSANASNLTVTAGTTGVVTITGSNSGGSTVGIYLNAGGVNQMSVDGFGVNIVQVKSVASLGSSTTAYLDVSNGGLLLNTSNGIKWANSAVHYFAGSADTGILRNAAGVVEVNNGTSGTYRDIILRNITPTGGTVTASTPFFNATQTWNNSGVVFTGFKINVTNTASDTTSKTVDIQTSGSTVVSIDTNGVIMSASPSQQVYMQERFGGF